MESAPLKTWELSLYETKRRPQEAITDDTEIAVSPRALHSELMCPICLDILKHTMTTKECLHRFCQVCIITALRSGNKECPTCRKKLVSKRSLRHDPNFDQLIAKIYPSREEFEAHEERVLAKLSKFATSVSCDSAASSGGARAVAATAGKKRQRSSLPQTQQQHQQADDASSLASEDNGTTAGAATAAGGSGGGAGISNKRSRGALSDDLGGVGGGGEDNNSVPAASSASVTAAGAAGGGHHRGCGDIELLLKPLPTWLEGAGVETKYLKTVCTATVAHLVNYLKLRQSLDQPTTAVAAATDETVEYAIYCWVKSGSSPAAAASSGGGISSSNYHRLNDQGFTLEAIREKFWSAKRVMDLYFERLSPQSSSS